MSVLACGRYRCDNIMCDRLILDSSHYLCERCYQELLLFKATWKQEMQVVREVRTRIEEFLRTEPGTYVGTDQGVGFEEEFQRLTGNYVQWSGGG